MTVLERLAADLVAAHSSHLDAVTAPKGRNGKITEADSRAWHSNVYAAWKHVEAAQDAIARYTRGLRA